MKLDFVKLHGLGNDFIFVDDMSLTHELTTEQVKQLCDRHFGIGADGVVLVQPSQRSDCITHMHYINADGTLAQMCGNGIRCTAKFLVDRGYVSPDAASFGIETLAGPKYIVYEVDEDKRLSQATVDMGSPILDPKKVPVDCGPTATTDNGISFVKELPISSPWGEFRFTCVSMGNPHAVCFLDDISSISDELFPDPSEKCLAALDVVRIGLFFESHPLFPEKTNVEFARLFEEGIAMRVFERGCGETLACGTGACATSVAATLTQRAGRSNDVYLLGGTLHISWENEGSIMMSGPATEVFRGTIEV